MQDDKDAQIQECIAALKEAWPFVNSVHLSLNIAPLEQKVLTLPTLNKISNLLVKYGASVE
jgi:hypothetical protein